MKIPEIRTAIDAVEQEYGEIQVLIQGFAPEQYYLLTNVMVAVEDSRPPMMVLMHSTPKEAKPTP